mgnify:CR=1 FL=1
MIGNDVIQGNIVTDLKAATAITALLASAGEIRELQYQGADFAYPALRVHVDDNAPIVIREQCDHANLTFTIRAFTEGGSSRSSSTLAAAVNARYHRRNFQGTGWYSWFRAAALLGPRRVGERLWMSEVIFRGVVYPTSAFVTPVG